MPDAFPLPPVERYIELEEYPWMPQDHAFSELGVYFDLPEEMDDSERLYWLTVTEVMCACKSTGPNGEVDLPPKTAVESVIAAAEASATDTIAYLQGFSYYCQRRSQRKGSKQTLSPEEQCQKALASYDENVWCNPRPSTPS